MYLARFDANGEEWVQAAAVIDGAAARESSSAVDQWELMARQLSAAARIPRATVAHRIAVQAGIGLRQTIALTASVHHEREVREIVAAFTRIERWGGGSVSLAQQPEERDQWLERLGPLRFCATAEAFSVGGVPLACPFRLSPSLDDLLIDACIGGYDLLYQLHIRAADVAPDWVRSARKSMLALRELPGIPAALIDWQEQLARQLGYASAFCEEYLAVDSDAVARTIQTHLADRFRAQYGPFGFPAPAFRFETNGYQDPLVTGVHSHDLDPLSPAALCSVATSAAERDELLAWSPSPRLLDMIDTAGGAQDVAPELPVPLHDGAMLPEPYDGPGAFAFASYKRQDLPRIASIVRMVQEMGVPVWYDRGIPGGAEWDDVIEERLVRAHFVIMFASQAAVDSKYVRREIKFADALDRPVLPILLEDATFAHGMRMLLTQYQMIDSRSQEFSRQLQSALTRLSTGSV